jgi:hypothetical protein
MLQNPTGGKLRSDSQGSGEFKAPRGARRHAGRDYECKPGQPVYAPCNGIVARKVYVYSDDLRWQGCEIVCPGRHIKIKLFYMIVDQNLIGTPVVKGEVVGTAQDIAIKYPGMTPHVHMAVIINPLATMSEGGNFYIDPDIIGVEAL